MADRKYSEPKCAFKFAGDHVETDKTVKNKITGTTLGAILGKSPFSSPFQVACALLGVGREVLDGKQAIEIGKYLEPKLIDYCAERYADTGAFIKAEEVFKKRDGDHDSWASDWKDDLFAGHLDGVVAKPDGNYVLEVKTTGNISAWEEGVPESYLLQVALYNHFMYQKDKAYVILGLVDDETRKDVTSWVPTDENVMLFEIDMDDEAITAQMNEAAEWYHAFIDKGITPPFDPSDPRDVELWNHLVAISSTDEDIQAALDRYEALSKELEEKKAEIKPLEDELDDLKTHLKDYMVASKKMEIVTTSKEMRGVITRSERTTVDRKLMVAAGVDPTPYLVRTLTYSFSFKKANDL